MNIYKREPYWEDVLDSIHGEFENHLSNPVEPIPESDYVEFAEEVYFKGMEFDDELELMKQNIIMSHNRDTMEMYVH